ncbi:MAG: hypothetical protein F6K00_01885 [Leptolyngbya sp. SIOISBB]|nr:hypothetical protein [Leptolyngbya sp. SIOISBB]
MYSSPSGEKVVIFQECGNFSFHVSSIYAYQARGPYRRSLGMLFMAKHGDADLTKDKFFDPGKINLTWSENESIMTWKLKDTQEPISGTLTLD